jgi:hypothetical protein
LRKLIAIFVAVSIPVGLLVAGCGGGDSADGEQIDKATFVEQANRICKQASGRLAAEVTSITSREESANPGSDSGETWVAVVEKAFVPRLEEELRQIRALGIPDDARKETEALLTAYQKSIDRTKAKAKSLAEIEGYIPYEGAELAATRLGASDCPVAVVSGQNTN